MTLLCASVQEKRKKKRRRREGGERDKDLIKDNLVLACQATKDKLNASLPPSLPCSVRRRLSSNESKTQFRTVTMVSTKKVGNYLPGVKDLSNRNKKDSEEMALQIFPNKNTAK